MNYVEIFLAIGQGLVLTVELLLGGAFIGLTLGVVLAILRYKKHVETCIKVYISLIRGTPVILQLSFFYFAIPNVIHMKLSILTAGILTLGLNSSAYVAEILRSGIESLPKGQFEAAQTLQISIWPMWKDIILPQVMRNIFPALINEFISLLKETALISTLGGMDLMRKAQSIASEHFTYFMPICMAGVYYYSLVLLIEYMGKKIEKGVFHVKYH
ncbi:MAG: amino acid ABC transporter permease [Candidatus Berkiellales bacterium]